MVLYSVKAGRARIDRDIFISHSPTHRHIHSLPRNVWYPVQICDILSTVVYVVLPCSGKAAARAPGSLPPDPALLCWLAVRSFFVSVDGRQDM